MDFGNLRTPQRLMATHYFKRYRMEIDLTQSEIGRARLTSEYRWRAWDPTLLTEHARVKYECFRQEMDRFLFPSLGQQASCEDLMRGISSHRGFVPETTWLIEYVPPDTLSPQGCGTIQGLATNTRLGSIQNLGIHPDHRGRGLGRALMIKALRGFRKVGVERVSLDVTADNVPAVRLYESLGFRCLCTTYRQLPQPLE